MNKKIFVISDLHLGNGINEKKKIKKLHIFFERIISGASDLYLNGDVFDFWFEYKTVIPNKYFDFLCNLKRLSNSGVKVHILAGNHDYWIGTFFRKEINAEVIDDHKIFEFGSKKVYITHGDGRGKGDYGYKILKKILRNKLSIFLFGLIHPDFAFRIANLVSGTSREVNKYKSLDEKIPSFVKEIWNKEIDIVISAHTHYPIVSKINNKIYANSGDWQEKFTYLVLTYDKIELNHLSDSGDIEKIENITF